MKEWKVYLIIDKGIDWIKKNIKKRMKSEINNSD
jgi:hypothetical protein